MLDSKQNRRQISSDQIAVFITLFLQVSVVIWGASSMSTSLNYTRESLKDLNLKLDKKLHDIDEKMDQYQSRLQATEQDVAVLKATLHDHKRTKGGKSNIGQS